MAGDLFFTYYRNGIRTEPDRKLFPSESCLSVTLELTIDDSYNARVSLNDECLLSSQVIPEICHCVALMAWGDGSPFDIQIDHCSTECAVPQPAHASDEDSDAPMRLAHVSTFPPLHCGIASFATDMIAAVRNVVHSKYSLHYGDAPAPDAVCSADVRSLEALAHLARVISASDCDAVCLQHEFGIWGGSQGEHIHAFLDNLSKPVVSVLHTTFGPHVRSAVQDGIMRRLVEQSVRVIVLTDLAKTSLVALLNSYGEKIVVLPHGVPDVPFAAPPARWKRGRSGRPCRLISPGFLRGSKGLETMLMALRQLLEDGRPVRYTIAGQSQVQFEGQQRYGEQLGSLVNALGLESAVELDVRYLTLEEQIEAIRRSHVGIFAYQDAGQSSSGALPLVLSVGRPAICTPFEYARAKAREGSAIRLAEDFGTQAVVRAVETLLDGQDYLEAAERAYAASRTWIWKEVGVRIRDECRQALSPGGTP
ncbi:MAG TPA: hypothetical protein VGK32_12745 [Vicinamibacterales bacterium]|jgi:glycosyltransferase involved in cell wall biosynthesis